jgi:peptide/nickel transport system permease protein
MSTEVQTTPVDLSASAPAAPQSRDRSGVMAAPRRDRERMPIAIVIALSLLAFVAALGLLAGMLAPFGYDEQNLALRLQPPALLGGPAGHWLGTDELGRDVLSRLLFSIRMSLTTALVGTLVAACIGTVIGFVAARFGGLVDEALMMLVDAQASVPFFILALAALAFLGNSLVLFCLLLGLHGWEVYARVVRGLVLATQSLPHVEAVRLLGAGALRLYGRHVLPSIAGVLVVKVTLNFPGTILLESGLSFLGLGVQPPLTSLGLMLGAGREYLLFAWWIAIVPGATIFLTTLSVSLVGDWLRDRLDPRLRHERR